MVRLSSIMSDPRIMGCLLQTNLKQITRSKPWLHSSWFVRSETNHDPWFRLSSKPNWGLSLETAVAAGSGDEQSTAMIFTVSKNQDRMLPCHLSWAAKDLYICAEQWFSLMLYMNWATVWIVLK